MIPAKLSLEQNYPNPFNPLTTIRYNIPSLEASNVSLIIYDVLGNEISVLVNKKHQPGEYEVHFDATNLASGIYYYQLKVEKYIQTKKMILMK